MIISGPKWEKVGRFKLKQKYETAGRNVTRAVRGNCRREE